MAQHRVELQLSGVIVRENLNPFRVISTRVAAAAVGELAGFFEFARNYRHELGVFTPAVTEAVVHHLCRPMVEGKVDLGGACAALQTSGSRGVVLELLPDCSVQRFDQEGMRYDFQPPMVVLREQHDVLAKLWCDRNWPDVLSVMVSVDVAEINQVLFTLKLEEFLESSERLTLSVAHQTASVG